MSLVEITEPALLIRISQHYRDGMASDELYEATRGVWVIGERRYHASYAFSVVFGMIHEVYEIISWHPAGSTTYRTRRREDVDYPGRWEFLADVAPAILRDKYVGNSVAHYFKKGAVNPVMYVNC
jgi:hypothetical protein